MRLNYKDCSICNKEKHKSQFNYKGEKVDFCRACWPDEVVCPECKENKMNLLCIRCSECTRKLKREATRKIQELRKKNTKRGKKEVIPPIPKECDGPERGKMCNNFNLCFDSFFKDYKPGCYTAPTYKQRYMRAIDTTSCI